MKIKRTMLILVTVSSVLMLFSACGKSEPKNEVTEENAAETTTEDPMEDAEVVIDEKNLPGKADSSNVKIDYKTSEKYTKEDMDAAIEQIWKEFNTWDGCVMHTIDYTDDQTCEDGVAYINDLGIDMVYDDCIVFHSSFHSPVKGGGAWEPDTEYEGWNWYLGRQTGGEWELLQWGY